MEETGDEQANDRECQHRAGRARVDPVESLRAELQAANEEARAEHEEDIAEDAPRQRRLDRRREARPERDDGDDQFGGVAERRVEKPTETRPRVECNLLRSTTKKTRERDQG